MSELRTEWATARSVALATLHGLLSEAVEEVGMCCMSMGLYVRIRDALDETKLLVPPTVPVLVKGMEQVA